ncbi:hypothetical protein [Chryseobacterium panacisoli]|nr:hypothetical protein [Chryseobacterium panacisoli]
MKRNYYALGITFFSLCNYAQVGINTASPDPTVMLEIRGPGKTDASYIMKLNDLEEVSFAEGESYNVLGVNQDSKVIATKLSLGYRTYGNHLYDDPKTSITNGNVTGTNKLNPHFGWWYADGVGYSGYGSQGINTGLETNSGRWILPYQNTSGATISSVSENFNITINNLNSFSDSRGAPVQSWQGQWSEIFIIEGDSPVDVFVTSTLSDEAIRESPAASRTGLQTCRAKSLGLVKLSSPSYNASTGTLVNTASSNEPYISLKTYNTTMPRVHSGNYFISGVIRNVDPGYYTIVQMERMDCSDENWLGTGAPNMEMGWDVMRADTHAWSYSLGIYHE